MPGINGTDVLLIVNTGTVGTPVWTVVGHQRDLSIDENTALVDMSSKESRAEQTLPGRYSAELQLDSLFVPGSGSYAALKAAMRDGTNILVRKRVQGTDTEQVECTVTNLSEGFPDQGAAVVSATIHVAGNWTPV